MRKILFAIPLVIICLIGFSQADTSKVNLLDTTALSPSPDTSNSSFKVDYSADQEQMNRNLNSFMQDLNERKKKEKRNAMLRIGFGIAMLIILIIGWRRRSAKK